MKAPNDQRDAQRLAAYRKTIGKGDAPPPATAPVVLASAPLPSLPVFAKSANPTGAGAPAAGDTAARALQKAGFVKTTGGETNYRKVAKFLILVGKDEAAKILAKLDPGQVEKISREIASIRRIEDSEAEALLAEFRALLRAGAERGGFSGTGGVETAREVLHAAFGKEKGDALLRRAIPETAENPFAFLEDFEGDQTALLLKDEAPSTIALVLSRISAKAAAAVLRLMEGERRMEIVRRLAKIGKTTPDTLERVAAALREKARSVGRADTQAVDGRAALAEILKRSDPRLGDRLLEELDEADPELATDLKGRLHTLSDVVNAESRPVQERLRSMSDRDIAMLIKGRDDDFREKILTNLSSARRTLVEEERQIMGAVPRKEADEVAREFLDWFRKGREEGRILLLDDDDVVV